MNTVVFLGPSLEPAVAAGLADVELLPPIKRGDIDALLARPVRPERIGIVDGEFMQSLSISPKEVLRALDSGVEMWGSSSMGALRAAELDVFGMTGVGQVYELFASGEIDADDEVAITFDPETLAPLCEPMVNIRVALSAARDRGVVPADVADAFVRAAKSLYFPDRRMNNVFAVLGDDISPEHREQLRTFLRTDAPDAKRADAVALLSSLGASRGA
ncbi:hypothetical protein UK23_29200 [Lentzea aerocolonigenes]|uniref:TfuA-like core domain-containing protein n=1 Tax=Lentzea aerocolonigenes TaxID=68170 RepID=A0A0F0GR87_LENAE|nr:TfuA-like protein [Lentzea aerocolonigenes]KJK44467.1 hypothetical protein UK23_29200 [Lentzea aerocolonigenes]